MSKKYKASREWLKQADYDIGTASAMFKSRKYVYTIFMCHLCIEKALKGLYAKEFKNDPPKIHHLKYFSEKLKLELSDEHEIFLDDLNRLSVPTRYPDDLKKILKEYRKNKTAKILEQTKGLLSWIKKKS